MCGQTRYDYPCMLYCASITFSSLWRGMFSIRVSNTMYNNAGFKCFGCKFNRYIPCDDSPVYKVICRKSYIYSKNIILLFSLCNFSHNLYTTYALVKKILDITSWIYFLYHLHRRNGPWKIIQQKIDALHDVQFREKILYVMLKVIAEQYNFYCEVRLFLLHHVSAH